MWNGRWDSVLMSVGTGRGAAEGAGVCFERYSGPLS